MADYNPRVIDQQAKNKLQKKLRDVGLVIPLTWNKRTGTLVSGHQRLEQLDSSQHYVEGKTDYLLDVAAVDVDEKTERELNVFINNASAMGNWDYEALAKLTQTDVDINALGFDQTEIQFMLHASDWEEDMNDPVRGDIDVINEMRKEGREGKKKFKKDVDDVEYYIVVVFANRQERDEFVRDLRLPIKERYFDAQRFREAAKKADL